MTETNRQSALYSAVSSFPADENITADDILERAAVFTQWLENDGTTQAAPTAAPVQRNAVEEITALANGYREQWGNLAVDEILGRLNELDGVPFEEAIRAAVDAVPALGFGRHLAEAVTEQIGGLLNDRAQQAAGSATAEPVGQTVAERIVALLFEAVRQYGGAAQPLLDRGRAAGGSLTKEVAIRELTNSSERRRYPAQVDRLIAQIRAL